MTEKSFARLLNELKQKEIGIIVRGNSIYFAPRSATDADLIRRIFAHKQEILAIIRSGVQIGSASPNASRINESTNKE